MPVRTRPRSLLLGAVVVAAVAIAAVLGLSGRGPSTTARGTPTAPAGGPAGAASASAPARVARPPVPHLLRIGRPTTAWQPYVTVGGRPAVWIARRSGVTMLRFDQHLTELHLHAGSVYPGGRGWLYGDKIAPAEARHLVAAFNGGFKFNVPGNGFVENGRTGLPLKRGLGSVVTYRNGITAVGAWGRGLPARGVPVLSVRQNLHLLVDRGRLPRQAIICPLHCWGATVGGHVLSARSALGITSTGELLWAAGERLTPASLGRALIRASVVSAVQLDINPFAVAGYIYSHRTARPVAAPLVPGQNGIRGQLRHAYTRDFFTVVARY